jgi:GAF domain-containing protein
MTSEAELIYKQAAALLDGERDPIANAANLSALIYQMLPDLNWAGFYFARNGELVLGPFQGKPACVRIAFGAGVCGTSYAKNETIVVPDVHAFPGHIACDAASNAEIVIPLRTSGDALGVLDLDSPVHNRFSEDDRELLEAIARLWVNASDAPLSSRA